MWSPRGPLYSNRDPADLAQANVNIESYAKYATGMQSVTVLISVIFNIIIARVWQEGIYDKVLKVKKKLLAAKATYTSLLVISLLVIASIYKVNWGLDALIAILAPIFFIL